MSFETKIITGHAPGTNLQWICTRHVDEGFGFGDEPAITCVDMTVHALEVGRPNVIFSTYETKEISPSMMRIKFNRGATDLWDQVEMARRIVTGWKNIKSGEKLEIEEPDWKKQEWRDWRRGI